MEHWGVGGSVWVWWERDEGRRMEHWGRGRERESEEGERWREGEGGREKREWGQGENERVRGWERRMEEWKER